MFRVSIALVERNRENNFINLRFSTIFLNFPWTNENKMSKLFPEKNKRYKMSVLKFFEFNEIYSYDNMLNTLNTIKTRNIFSTCPGECYKERLKTEYLNIFIFPGDISTGNASVGHPVYIGIRREYVQLERYKCILLFIRTRRHARRVSSWSKYNYYQLLRTKLVFFTLKSCLCTAGSWCLTAGSYAERYIPC